MEGLIMKKIFLGLLLLGLVVCDTYGQKREQVEDDPEQAAEHANVVQDGASMPAEKRQEVSDPTFDPEILFDMPSHLLSQIILNSDPVNVGPINTAEDVIKFIKKLMVLRLVDRRFTLSRIVEILRSVGIRLDLLNEVLSRATKRGYSSYVVILVGAGADANVVDETGKTPLFYAVMDGRLDQVEVLVRSGANVKAVDDSGLTVLSCAANAGELGVLDTLLRLSTELGLGLNVNDRDVWGGTALHWAVIGTLPNCTNFLRRLLELDANVAVYSSYSDEFLEQFSISDIENVKAKVYGQTPLHFAVMLGKKEQAQILVEHYLRHGIEIPEDLKPELRKMGFRV